MQLFAKHSISVALAFGLGCNGLTYWIDSSCDTRYPGVVKGIIDEAIDMGKKGREQLGGSADAALSTTFEQIFKTSDAAKKSDVSGILGRVAGMTQTADFEGSDVRIYCDDDKIGPPERWRLMQDIPNDPNPNSQRPAAEQDYWDVKNFMFRNPDTRGCKDRGTLAETFKDKMKIKRAQSHNPNREVITICDLTLDGAKRHTLKSIKKTADLSKANMDTWSSLSSITILHEFTHLDSVGSIRGDPDPEGWNDIRDLSSSDALQTADCYGYFGLCALFTERDFRLSADRQEAYDGKIIRISTAVGQNLPPNSKRGLGLVAPSSLETARSRMREKRRGLGRGGLLGDGVSEGLVRA